MAIKKLTDKGIEEIEEEVLQTQNIEIERTPSQQTTKKEPIKQQPIPQEKREEVRKQFNDDPITKRYGFFAVKRGTYIALWIFAIISLLVMAGGIYYFTDNFSKKDLAPKVENTINPNVTAYFNNTNVIDSPDVNITINMDDNITSIIAKRVIDIINNKTNSTF